MLRSDRTPAATVNAGYMVMERSQKESIHDLLTKKREIFFLRMNIVNKRDDIRNLEERARKEEEDIVKSRQILEDEAKQFEITLKENKDRADVAVKKAEYVTQLRKDKFMKAEGLRKEIEAIQNETVENQEALKRSLQYKAFLDEPILKSWLEQQQTYVIQQQLQGQGQQQQHYHQQPKDHDEVSKSICRIQSRNQENSIIIEAAVSKKTNDAMIYSHEENNRPTCKHVQGGENCEGAANNKIACSFLKSPTLELEGESNLLLSSNRDDEEELSSSMDFRDPQQLLEILHVMEERNPYLIQNKQETEQALDKQKYSCKELERTMEAQTESLAMQIAQLESTINQEKTKADQLKQHMILLVRDSLSKQDIVTGLHAEVRNLYERCGFDYVTATPTTLFMLGDLEARLEDLFASTARLPAAHAMKAKKEREKTRRESNQSRQEAIQTTLQKEQNRKIRETNRPRVVNNKTAAGHEVIKPSFRQSRRSVYDDQWKKMVMEESTTVSDETKYL